ncbi:MAG: hypothetical protein AMXMBFR64_35460 [Myxococcales bacterium]
MPQPSKFRSRALARIERLNRVLRAVGDVNRQIVRARSALELARETCRVLVESESYGAAMIVLCDATGAPVSWAQQGLCGAFAPLAASLAEGRLPACLHLARDAAGAPIRPDLEGSCEGCPMTAHCQRYSLHLAAELRRDGERHGYVLVASAKDAAATDEHDLFGGLKDDLAFALASLAVRDAHDRARAERDSLEEQLRAAQKMEAVGRLAGGIAHDFNNLLTVILNLTSFGIEDLPEGDPLRADLCEIQAAGRRGAQLTRQLLAFSRRQVLDPQIVSLTKVVTTLVPMLRRVTGEDVEFDVQTEPDLWHTLVDPGQMEQALLNLVVNACDAMPEGGRITIQTANVDLDAEFARARGLASGHHVLIAVRDTGCGMTEEVKSHIFEPFFTTKGVGKGTGLGLAMVYGLVMQSGGAVTVSTAPGAGASFELLFPRCGATTGASPERPLQAPIKAAGETVLLVEDEDGVRMATRRMLQSVGFSVLCATDGLDALEVLEGHPGPIDVLLTDVIMPRMSGPALAARVRELRPGTRILFMSGYTDDALARHGVLEPGVHLLVKPFDRATLIDRVLEAACRVPGAPRTPP